MAYFEISPKFSYISYILSTFAVKQKHCTVSQKKNVYKIQYSLLHTNAKKIRYWIIPKKLNQMSAKESGSWINSWISFQSIAYSCRQHFDLGSQNLV